MMTSAQYKHARKVLGWTHAKIAETLGIKPRQSFRYQAGDGIGEPAARLLRLLVLLRLTTSERKFDDLINELRTPK